MKPLNQTEQARRVLRWIRYGALTGFILMVVRLIVFADGALFSWTDTDPGGLNATSFAFFVIAGGAAGGLLAMLINWQRGS